MNPLRLTAICTIALLTGSAWAQNSPPAGDNMTNTAAVPASSDVGGAVNATGSGGNAMMPATRQQVYQDLVRSEQSGQRERLSNDLYRGN